MLSNPLHPDTRHSRRSRSTRMLRREAIFSFIAIFAIVMSIIPAAVAATATVSSDSLAPVAARSVLAPNQTCTTQPRNIIVMIGDGMGPQQVLAANYYNGGDLSFETLPYQGDVTTYSADSSVTDSAAAATAMAAGSKVNNGVISLAIPGDSSELETALESYKATGRMVGLVSTAYMTHATPAGWGAHESSRSNYNEIEQDYLNQTQPHVLLGGAKYMDPTSASKAGYTVVETRAAMQGLDTETATMVSGQFGEDHMPYEYDGDYSTYPHLREMTQTALDILDNDPDGFFLMVEAARIDHAGHMSNNDPNLKTNRNIQETLEFGRAVQVVMDWVDDSANGSDWSNTLLIVTADHETGDLTVQGDNGAGNLPDVSWGSTSHTGANAPVYAKGVHADQVTGTLNNIDIYSISVMQEPCSTFTFAITVDQRQYTGSGSYDNSNYYRGALEAMSGIDSGAFMVSPGDIDPPADSRWTIDQVLDTDYMWYPAVGNHEAETSSDMSYLRSYDYDANGAGVEPDIVNTGPSGCPETTYSFDYGNAHFVAINEYCNENGDTELDGDVSDHVYNWLVSDLQATDKEHIFVFGHEPAYPQPDVDTGESRHVGDSLDKYPSRRDRFWNLLRDEGVVAYICGHTHKYSAVQFDGVWQLDAGHARGQGDTGAASTFMLIHVDGSTVTYDAYRDTHDGDYDYDDIIHSGTLATGVPITSVSFQDGVSPDASYSGTEDTYISENTPDTNYGNSASCYVDGDDPSGSGKDLSTLLYWDIGDIPEGSTVGNASVTLNVFNSLNHTYNLYEMKRDWVENEATWNIYSTGNNWQTAGALGSLDRGNIVLGTLSPTSTGAYIISLNSDGLALVQSWVDNPASNQGLIIANSGASDGVDFYCSETSTASDRPKLSITYSQTVKKPTLVISITNGTDIVLTWDDDDLNCSYEIYRQTMPYFDPDSTDPALTLDSPATTHTFSGDASNPDVNYSYLVRAISCTTDTTADSIRTGGFDYALQPGSTN